MRIPKIYRSIIIVVNVLISIIMIMMWKSIAFQTKTIKDFVVCSLFTIVSFFVINWSQLDGIKTSRSSRNKKFKYLRKIRRESISISYKEMEGILDALSVGTLKKISEKGFDQNREDFIKSCYEDDLEKKNK